MKTTSLFKTTRIVALSGLILSLLWGCNSEEATELKSKTNPPKLNGIITISGAEALYPVMKIWAEEFTKDKPDLTIQVEQSSSDSGLAKLKTGQTNLAMVSRSLTPDEEAQGLWYFTVSKEGVIPIISGKNPFLEEVLKKGIQRSTLIAIFTSANSITWGDITGTENKLAVKPIIRSDLSGTAEVWSEYLGVEQKEIVGMPLLNDIQVIEAVKNEPLSISFCNAHAAYNLEKNKIQEGLSVLPIDFNNNGMIDSKEQFYEDLCKVQRAAYLGKYPSHLCRELFLVSNGKPSNRETLEFLEWIYTDGQKLAAKAGYAEIRQCQAKEILKLLNE